MHQHLKRLCNTTAGALLAGMPPALAGQIEPGLGVVALGGMALVLLATSVLAARAKAWRSSGFAGLAMAVVLSSPALAVTSHLPLAWSLAAWGFAALALAAFAACDDPLAAMAQLAQPLGERSAGGEPRPAVMPDGRSCTVYDPGHPMFGAASAGPASAWQSGAGRDWGSGMQTSDNFHAPAAADFAHAMEFNPTTGMPMIEGSGIDIGGTAYGAPNSSMDMHNH